MRKITFIIAGIFFALSSYTPTFPQNSVPITTAIKWKGLDTLSKYYRSEKFKKSQNPHAAFDKGGKNESKIPFEKGGHDNILGEPISDPRVIFSTYFGGNGYDCGNSVAFDSKENIYMVGYSGSTNLATTDSCYQKDKSGGHDAFIAKFTNKGKALWITYLGGMNTDVATDCIVDDSDNLIVVGKTDSPDFPFTEGTYHGSSDVFITKFSSEGKILWSKCFGDVNFNAPQDIAKAENKNFIITGYTSGDGLPTKDDVHQPTNAGNIDAFIAKFDIDGNLIWCTYFGGGNDDIGTGIACDTSTGNIAICGYTYWAKDNNNVKFFVTPNAFQKDTTGAEDAFVALFNIFGSCIWSTLCGGKWADKPFGIIIDNDRSLCFTGETGSSDYPTTENAFQKNKNKSSEAFITKFSQNSKLIWSTFLGGVSDENTYSIDTDSENNIWLTGFTMSTDFPTTNDAIFNSNVFPDNPDPFFTRFNPLGVPTWSSYYYSRAGLDFAYKIKAINNNKLIVTGETDGTLFPVTTNCFQEKSGSFGYYDGFLVLIDLLHTDIIENSDNSDNIVIYRNFTDNIMVIKTHSDEEVSEVSIYDLLGNNINSVENINQNLFQVQMNPSNCSETELLLLKITTNKRTIIKKFIY